jgi:hypothetical protein
MSEQLDMFDTTATYTEQAQAIFDRVARHLFAQGDRAIVEGDVCAYRGEGGMRCAVGVLITDDEYHPRMEGHDAYSLLCEARGDHDEVLPSRWPTLVRLDPFASLLQDLQEVHDDPLVWLGTVAMRDKLRRVATTHRLDADVLEDLSFEAVA